MISEFSVRQPLDSPPGRLPQPHHKPVDDPNRLNRTVAPEELEVHLVERLARRMRAGLVALGEDRLVEMEHGVVVADAAAEPDQP